MNDYYSLLGVRREASASEIAVTYRRILKEKFQEAGYSFLFTDVTQAYRTLSNPEKRKSYDLLLQKVVGKYIVQNPNNPTPAEKKFQSGLNAMDQKNFQVAVDFFTQAIKLEPERSHFYSQLGMALGMFNGRLAEAERYCKKAIELEPDNPEMCYNLGFLYQRHNLVDAAQQAFLQAQQAEQTRWENVFNQSSAVIELQNIDQEDIPANEPAHFDDEQMESPVSEDHLELAEPEIPDVEQLSTSVAEDHPEKTEPVKDEGGGTIETAQPEPEETEVSEDFGEQIILNSDAVSWGMPDIEAAEEAAIERVKENFVLEGPAASFAEKMQPEPEAISEPRETEAIESGDQVVMAHIIDNELGAETEEYDKQGTFEAGTGAPAEPDIHSRPEPEVTADAVEPSGPELMEPKAAEIEPRQAVERADAGDVVSTPAMAMPDDGQDDDILKDLASLEADLAEVDASSGIGSGDNGLLLEMRGQQDIAEYSSDGITTSDMPQGTSEKTEEQESISLDDLEDEALSLLRELGLNPSEYASGENEEAGQDSLKEEAPPTDASERSEPDDTEAEPEHDDLEELKKLEEMERKMAEELERLKQEREKLKKKKKKKK